MSGSISLANRVRQLWRGISLWKKPPVVQRLWGPLGQRHMRSSAVGLEGAPEGVVAGNEGK
jgi:hypothetical protein